jgi:hypothetical protein
MGRTSVSIANSGFQLSGGIILAIPYFLPSGAIFCMYLSGSLNSSSVGRNVGASVKPCGLILLGASRLVRGCPFRSTLDISNGAAFRALKGIVEMPFVKTPPFLLRDDGFAPLAGDALTVPPAEDCPPPDGGTTMTRKGG